LPDVQRTRGSSLPSELPKLDDVATHLHEDAQALKAAIQEHCWNETDGFFYSVDLNLLVRETDGLHAGKLARMGLSHPAYRRLVWIFGDVGRHC
jgi:hypothetical protein